MSTATEHEHVGTFDRERIVGLAGEIERQKNSRRDYVYPASALSMTDDGHIVFGARDSFAVAGTTYTEWSDAETAANAIAAESGKPCPIEPLGKTGALPLTPTAESQLATRLGIPLKYIKSLRVQPATSGKMKPAEVDAAVAAHEVRRRLAADNFRTLLSVDTRKFFVRTLDGRARAVMSDRYRVLDNADLFYASAETFKDVGAELWMGRLWDDGFQMLGVSQGIAGVVRTDRTFDPGDGWQSRWYGKEGDVHNAAVSVRNSETGQGGLTVKPAILRRVCANFNVWADGISTIHAGGTRMSEGLLKHLGMGDATDENTILSAQTREAESRVIWMKVKDVITTAFNPEKFQAYIDRLNDATRQVLAKPEKAVENVVAEYGITEERKSAILASLLGSGDRTRYGLVQAVTFTAHAADADGAPDEAHELERLGGELVEMEDGAFAKIGELVTA